MFVVEPQPCGSSSILIAKLILFRQSIHFTMTLAMNPINEDNHLGCLTMKLCYKRKPNKKVRVWKGRATKQPMDEGPYQRRSHTWFPIWNLHFSNEETRRWLCVCSLNTTLSWISCCTCLNGHWAYPYVVTIIYTCMYIYTSITLWNC